MMNLRTRITSTSCILHFLRNINIIALSDLFYRYVPLFFRRHFQKKPKNNDIFFYLLIFERFNFVHILLLQYTIIRK